MGGKLHTSCILYIAKRHPFGCPKCLWLKPYPPNLFLARERICDYASAARRILETIRQRFRRPAAPRPKTQVPVSAEPNGNLIVELIHRIFRRFRFQIEYHAVFVLSRVVVSRHTHDSFLPWGGSVAVPLAVYKYSRPAYQQAGELYTPYILHIQAKKKGTLPDAPCCRRLNPPRNQSSLPRHQ